MGKWRRLNVKDVIKPEEKWGKKGDERGIGFRNIITLFIFRLLIFTDVNFWCLIGFFRGYNIGIRLIDEFLAKSNVSRCNDFRETTDVIAKVLYCLLVSLLAIYKMSKLILFLLQKLCISACSFDLCYLMCNLLKVTWNLILWIVFKKRILLMSALRMLIKKSINKMLSEIMVRVHS